MAINSDFRDLFAALNEAGAKYLLIGGYAVAFHARPRFTKDLDVWVEPSEQNAARVFEALRRFGAPISNLAPRDLAQPDLIFQMGLPPNRIDILTSISGVTFSEAWSQRVQTTYGEQNLHVISRRHLLENKRASGRPQDLIDAELLADESE